MPLADDIPAPSKPSALGSTKKSRSGAPLPQSGSVPASYTDFTEPDLFADAPMFSAATLKAPKVDKVAEALAAAAAAETTKDYYADLLEKTTPSVGELAVRGRREAAEKEARALGDIRIPEGLSPAESAATGYRSMRDQAKQDGDKVDVEKEMAESAKRATRRGLNQQRGRGIETMTTEEYNALTPKQKAAIDLNTLLVNAVREDRGVEAKGENPGGESYDAQVAEVFGEDAKNTRYAPNTVQLLDDANIEIDDAKLNDFLKLKVAITAEDLKDFAPPLPGEGPDLSLATASKQRETLQGSLINAVRETRNDPASASALRESSRDLLGLNEMLGFNTPNPEGTPDEQASFYFQGGLARLAAEPDTQKVMADLRAGMPAEYWPKFIAFLDAKSRESKQYHIPIQTSSDGSTVTPKEFRAKLELNK